jgi:hypothetical protein
MAIAGAGRSRAIGTPLGQQFHGGIDEVVPQISRFRHQAGDVRAVDDQRYLRRDAVGIINAQLGDDCCEPGPHFLVALARRLAIIMHAMLRDGTEFASA